MTYKFLDHTADVLFEVEGENLEELFTECANALNETIHGNVKIIEQVKKPIKIKAENLESLLYKFLEEFLFLLDSENLIFDRVENIIIDGKKFTLNAVLIGDHAEKYHFTNDVKAITFNNMEITKIGGKYNTKVLLDV